MGQGCSRTAAADGSEGALLVQQWVEGPSALCLPLPRRRTKAITAVNDPLTADNQNDTARTSIEALPPQQQPELLPAPADAASSLSATEQQGLIVAAAAQARALRAAGALLLHARREAAAQAANNLVLQSRCNAVSSELLLCQQARSSEARERALLEQRCAGQEEELRHLRAQQLPPPPVIALTLTLIVPAPATAAATITCAATDLQTTADATPATTAAPLATSVEATDTHSQDPDVCSLDCPTAAPGQGHVSCDGPLGELARPCGTEHASFKIILAAKSDTVSSGHPAPAITTSTAAPCAAPCTPTACEASPPGAYTAAGAFSAPAISAPLNGACCNLQDDARDIAPTATVAKQRSAGAHPAAARCEDTAAPCIDEPEMPSKLLGEQDQLHQVFAAAHRFEGAVAALSSTTLAGLLKAGGAKACGSGGQGSVSCLQLPGVSLPLAIKACNEPTKYKDFLRECDVWSSWAAACPQYVIPLLAAQYVRRKPGSSRGCSYFAMPACSKGRCLSMTLTTMHRLRQEAGGVFSVDKLAFVQRVLGFLVVALDAAHQHGIVWADLKPPNIMLGRDGEPQIIDFGSASRVPAEGLRHTPMQSKGYRAPECGKKKGGFMGCAIDMWALGCVGVEMVLGFDTFFSFVGKHDVLSVDKAAAAEWPSSAPATLHALVFDCLLVHDPVQRASAARIMQHPYFEGLDWEAVRSGAAWAR